MKFAVLTDSVTNLDPEYVAENKIKVIPSTVVFNGKKYLDDSHSLDTRQMLHEMRNGAGMATDIPATEEDYHKAYYELLEDADHIISIHSSCDIVPEFFIAGRAAKQFGNLVTVLDTRTTSVGVGLQVMRVVEDVKQGYDVAAIAKEQRRVAAGGQLYFVPDDLKYLQINKRIGAATAVIGNLVRLKPFLGVRDGKIIPAGQAFGHKRAIEGMAALAEKFYRQHGQIRMAFGCTIDGEEGRNELRHLLRHIPFADMGDWELGLITAANAGPGTVGIALEPA